MGKICCILLLSHTLNLYLIIYMCLQFMYIKSSNILSKDEKYLLELLQLLIVYIYIKTNHSKIQSHKIVTLDNQEQVIDGTWFN